MRTSLTYRNSSSQIHITISSSNGTDLTSSVTTQNRFPQPHLQPLDSRPQQKQFRPPPKRLLGPQCLVLPILRQPPRRAPSNMPPSSTATYPTAAPWASAARTRSTSKNSVTHHSPRSPRIASTWSISSPSPPPIPIASPLGITGELPGSAVDWDQT